MSKAPSEATCLHSLERKFRQMVNSDSDADPQIETHLHNLRIVKIEICLCVLPYKKLIYS